MKPIFSIIIPVYNTEKYILRCLESVNNQTYQNFEVIIIDDGSTDNSKLIVENYIKDKNTFTLESISNHGVSYARNIGINKASGKYITFLDSDDILSTKFLSYCYNFISDNKVDLLQTSIKEFLRENEILDCPSNKDNKSNKINNIDAIESLLSGINNNSIIPGPVAKIYSNEIIKHNRIKFNEEFNMFEDGIFNIEYLQHCNNIYISNYETYYYRKSNIDSLTKKCDSNRLNQKIKQINYINSIIDKNIDKKSIYIFSFCTIISVFQGFIYHKKSKLDYSHRIKEIKKILKEEKIHDAISALTIFDVKSIYKKILLILIKIKLFYVLDLVCRLKYK